VAPSGAYYSSVIFQAECLTSTALQLRLVRPTVKMTDQAEKRLMCLAMSCTVRLTFHLNLLKRQRKPVCHHSIKWRLNARDSRIRVGRDARAATAPHSSASHSNIFETKLLGRAQCGAGFTFPRARLCPHRVLIAAKYIPARLRIQVRKIYEGEISRRMFFLNTVTALLISGSQLCL
jgi:hypothetical protein